ncbi:MULTISPECIES: XRE family transcriptional regulator [Stenotrophomonas]|uniref:XRE family transcriptional regulator n=1 Tax=Stenotrophomonas TaxID=40323 RepID=UPI000A93367F|nr:XRE family transcriptional regulator [Stenotrophomonas maltophilia]
MNDRIEERNLSLAFGPESSGDSPEERAKTSKLRFVRGQLQLARYSGNATGRVLEATEALELFGWSALLKVGEDGSMPLISSAQEPAHTLKRRREELGLSYENLKRKTKVPVNTIKAAETPGARTPIRILEKLAQAMALDEQVLGMVPDAGRDASLGVRLREMGDSNSNQGFTAHTVLQFAEAAWIVDRQVSIQKRLSEIAPSCLTSLPYPDPDYSYPTYKQGYRLARKTRQLLDLDDEEPVESVRKVIEDQFGLPLVQESMTRKLAGATLANGAIRGIMVNEAGSNTNVWVRRMTLCHELGHLLWDPDDKLKKVTVDTYADLEQSDREQDRDIAEIRANAFAVAFLAPALAVERIYERCNDPTSVVSAVMSKFGISATAAKHHVRNVTGLNTASVRNSDLPTPEPHLIAMENLTLDYFPVKSVPSSRRGKFAWNVAKAQQLGLISLDSAESYLGCDANSLTEDALRIILELR